LREKRKSSPLGGLSERKRKKKRNPPAVKRTPDVAWLSAARGEEKEKSKRPMTQDFPKLQEKFTREE